MIYSFNDIQAIISLIKTSTSKIIQKGFSHYYFRVNEQRVFISIDGEFAKYTINLYILDENNIYTKENMLVWSYDDYREILGVLIKDVDNSGCTEDYWNTISYNDLIGLLCRGTNVETKDGGYLSSFTDVNGDRYTVVTVVDCWNNNLVFVYKNDIPYDGCLLVDSYSDIQKILRMK